MQEVCDFLKRNHTYYLATVDGDQPRVRPFGTADIYNGKLYIQTGKIKPVSHQLHANAKAEICCFGEGMILRVAGKLIADDDLAAQEYLLSQNPGLKSIYAVGDGNYEVLYFEDATATFTPFPGPGEPKVIKF